MDDKIRALALVRAAIVEDEGSMELLLTSGPYTVELVAHLAALAAQVLEHGAGTGQALAYLDRYLQLTLEQSP